MVLGDMLNAARHRLDCRGGNNNTMAWRTASLHSRPEATSMQAAGRACLKIPGCRPSELKYNCALNPRSRSLLMPKSSSFAAIALCLALVAQAPVSAQSAADPDINKKIRQEE